MMDKYINTYWYSYNDDVNIIIHITGIPNLENKYKVEYQYVYSYSRDGKKPAFNCENDYIIINTIEDLDDILKTEDYKPATKELFDSLHNKYNEYRKMLDAINTEVKKEYKKFFIE